MGNALQQADVRGALSAAKDKTAANNKNGWRWRIVRDDETASQYRLISCADNVPALVLGTEAPTVRAESDQAGPGQRWQLQLRTFEMQPGKCAFCPVAYSVACLSLLRFDYS